MNKRIICSAPSFVAFVSLLAAGCAVDSRETDPSASDTASTVSEALYFTGTPWKNGVVPVCWNEGGTKDVATGKVLSNAAQLKADFRSFVESGWGSIANITFTGWGTCASGPKHSVVLQWDSNNPRWVTFGLGDPGDNGFDLISGSPFSTDLQYRAIHEMGHALGAHHEQQRPDNFDQNGKIIHDCGLGDNNTPVGGGTTLTGFDADSIMNYCGRGVISAFDAIGMRVAYGVAKSDIGMTSSATSAWKVIGVGDFNGDGFADVAWRRSSGEGEVRLWLLNGAGAVLPGGDVGMTSVAGPEWKVVGVGDFDRDGKADLAWRRTSDEGEVRFWLLDGNAQIKSGGNVGMNSIAGPDWKVVGIGDFDRDGVPDLAWHRQTDENEVRFWFLDGTGQVKNGGDVGMTAIAGSDWQVVGVGDFDGDGMPDLAWRRKTDTDEVRIWLLKSATGGVKEDLALPRPDAGWKVVGVSDFSGDHKADIAWRRQTDELEVRIWSITSQLQL